MEEESSRKKAVRLKCRREGQKKETPKQQCNKSVAPEFQSSRIGDAYEVHGEEEDGFAAHSNS